MDSNGLRARGTTASDAGTTKSSWRSSNLLSTWLKSNARTPKKTLDMFKDSSGVRRYIHNWQVVSEEDKVTVEGSDDAYRQYLFCSGRSCMDLNLDLNMKVSDTGPSKDNSNNNRRQVLFMEDYVKTWNYLAAVRGEALGKHALLFEMSLLLLFDRRSVNAMWYLLLYCNTIFFVLFFLDRRPLQRFNSVLTVFLYVFLWVGYRSCCSVYKASWNSSLLAAYDHQVHSDAGRHTMSASLGNLKKGRSNRGSPSTDGNVNNRPLPSLHATLYDNDGALPFTFLLRLYFQFFWLELRSALGSAAFGTWKC